MTPDLGEALLPTPSQTVGPFFHHCLPWPQGPAVVPADHPAAVVLEGAVWDGDGAPVADAVVEVWQVDPQGHPVRDGEGREGDGRDRDDPEFRGFGRCPTDERGHYRFTTLKPGGTSTVDGDPQAPYVHLLVFARGLLRQVVTRVYFPDEPDANERDPVLAQLPAQRRERLVARAVDGGYAFDVHLQGPHETPFFAA